jgi:hypothetical protein
LALLLPDPIEDPIHEGAGVLRPVLLRQLDGLVDRDLGRDVGGEEELVRPQAKDVPINERQPLEPPAYGALPDQGVDLLPVGHDTNEGLFDVGALIARVDLLEHLRKRRLDELPLIEGTKQELARLSSMHQERKRRPKSSRTRSCTSSRDSR